MTLDWLRVVHPEGELERLRELLVRRFGAGDLRRGRWFYTDAEGWEGGLLLLWGQREASELTCCVDVPGGVLAAMEPAERIAFCRELSLGGRVTRLDVAVDAKAEGGVGLIDAVLGSCERGELCGARVWEPKVRFASGEVEAYGVCIGRRGREGSGRYVRAYDKGLESGTAALGAWERLEVEFTDDCATEVASDLLGGGDWERRAFERVCGAVDFRHVATGASRELGRRKVCAWWVRWCEEGDPRATVARRSETTLDRYVGWVRHTVLPTVRRLGEDAGCMVGDVLRDLLGDLEQVRPREVVGAMRGMLQEWRRRSSFDPEVVLP